MTSTPLTPLDSAAAGSRRPWRRAARALRIVSIAAGSALLLGWLALYGAILPHIDRWRGVLEAEASERLGAPVTIGAIDAKGGGWLPALELTDVSVRDAEGRVALGLPRVHAVLSPRSLLALDVVFAQLYIEAPRLDVRRDAAGRIRIAGIDLGAGEPSDDSDAADWFLRQSEFVIRGGTVTWTDEARKAPPLALERVDLVVRNGLAQHAVRLDATPPADWGERFSVRGRFRQPLFAAPGDWRRWSGQLYAELPRADVRELKRYLTLPFELSEGAGALRGWFELDNGRPRRATVDLALGAVALRFGPQLETMRFAEVAGRVDAERDDDGAGDRTRIAVADFGFVTGDGLRWPASDLAAGWRDAADGSGTTGGDFRAERLDIGVMAEIASRVPLGAALRELLAELAPRGAVSAFTARWEGPIDAPRRYAVKGTLADLSLRAKPAARPDAIGRPGFAGAGLELDATEAGGKATLAIRDGRIELPGVFAEPRVPLETASASLRWTVTPPAAATAGGEPAITLEVSGATFANADARGAFDATWRTGPVNGRFPGTLALDGQLLDGRALRVARYLPLGLPADVRDYVAHAVQGGTIPRADVRVRGDLRDFPFQASRGRPSPGGEFRVAAKVADLTFAFMPSEPGGARSEWPSFTHGAGELVVDASSLVFKDARARLGGVEFQSIGGGITGFADSALLTVGASARGGLAEMLRLVQSTPVDRWTGGALARATGSGIADLKLGLGMPLDEPARATARGSVVLAGNDVRIAPDTPLLAATRGRIDFDERTFQVADASTRIWGQDVTFSGGHASRSRPAPGSTPGDAARDGPSFSAEGVVSAESLRRAPELGIGARAAGLLQGQARWSGSLAFADSGPALTLRSDLVGMAIDLPAPIGKAAAAPRPLVVETRAAADGTEHARVTLGGELLQAVFQRGGAGAASLRGALRVVDGAGKAPPALPAEPLAVPPSGIQATLVAQQLDVDAWRSAFDRVLDPASAVAAAVPPPTPVAATGTPATPRSDDADDWLPDRIALHVGELTAGGRQLTSVQATLVDSAGSWRARIAADQLDGTIDYRPPRRATGAGRVVARLARLSLPKGDAERVETLLDAEPETLPALDIVVDAFELRGRKLGRLEIVAANRTSGRAREWLLSKLVLATPEAELNAVGRWTSPGPGSARRTALDFTLVLADSGGLLERLGYDGIVRGGKGSLSGDIAWTGSPFSLDVARLVGDVKVRIGQGRFLKADPGAARLLGVLSLQSLPRRLSLDFRDLFGAGFAFDEVTGDVRLGDGKATTNNLRMRGASAAVLMEGSADLVRETQDLRVVVVPEINAGTASLAFAIINPAVGLGTFLAQVLLRQPLTAAGTREFHVTGDWDDAKVERVSRSTAAAPVANEARRE